MDNSTEHIELLKVLDKKSCRKIRVKLYKTSGDGTIEKVMTFIRDGKFWKDQHGDKHEFNLTAR